MRMADELGFKVNNFHHAAESYKVASMIARHGGAVAGLGCSGRRSSPGTAFPSTR